jgi:hypothetical protein
MAKPYPDDKPSLLSDHGACTVLANYCWLICESRWSHAGPSNQPCASPQADSQSCLLCSTVFVDCFMMTLAYYIVLGWCKDPWAPWLFDECVEGDNDFDCVHSDLFKTAFMFMMFRSLLAGITQLHLAVRSDASWLDLLNLQKQTSRPTSIGAAQRALRSAGRVGALFAPLTFSIAMGFVAAQLLWIFFLDGTLGVLPTDAFVLNVGLNECLQKATPTAHCQGLHEVSDGIIFRCLQQFLDLWSGGDAFGWLKVPNGEPNIDELVQQYSWVFMSSQSGTPRGECDLAELAEAYGSWNVFGPPLSPLRNITLSSLNRSNV